jgi:hypothetical protein
MEKKTNSGIIVLMGIIIVVLAILCVLFATNIISLNINLKSKNDESSDSVNIDDNINDAINDENNYDRDEIILKLKEALTDDEWVKNNLYSKINCFGEEVDDENQNLFFLTFSYEENNPIVLVENSTIDDFILILYKVYFSNGTVMVENVTGDVKHPSQGQFSIDESQGLVVYEYAHMGYYTFTAYDIKSDKITTYDTYKCDTGNCDYEYKGDKQYNSLSYIKTELTSENISNYLK